MPTSKFDAGYVRLYAVLLVHFACVFRYRVLLEGVLANIGSELIDTLKLFIEASKFNTISAFLSILTAYHLYSCE